MLLYKLLIPVEASNTWYAWRDPLHLIPGSMVVKTIAGSSIAAMFLQAVVPVLPPEVSVFAHISELGSLGLLAMAVVVLWRKCESKDAMLMEIYKSAVTAITENRLNTAQMTETSKRLSETHQKMSDTLDSIKEVVARIIR